MEMQCLKGVGACGCSKSLSTANNANSNWYNGYVSQGSRVCSNSDDSSWTVHF